MFPEASFLFAIAGLNASLGGLSGLVAGLRRGTEMRAVDLFRLREIVEFSFANVLIALSTVPLALILGSTSDATRILALATLGYIVLHWAVLMRRHLRAPVPGGGVWYGGVIFINFAALVAVAATVVTGGIGAYAGLLTIMLARPMFAFLLVLASFETS